LSLQAPLVLIRWIVVVLAVLVWLIVVPILELVAMGLRAVSRSTIARRLRRPDELLAVAARPNDGPAPRE
jgi:hypothetical protein